MAYGYLQQQEAANPNASTTIAVASMTPTPGNTIVYAAGYLHASAQQTVTITDTNTNTWLEGGNFFDGTTKRGIRGGVCKSVKAGAFTATATFGASVNDRFMVIREYSGLETVGTIIIAGDYIGAYQSSSTNAADNWTTGTTVPDAQPAMVFGVVCNFVSVGTMSAGTGYGNGSAIWNFGFGGNQGYVEDKRITSLSAVAATFTSSSIGDAGPMFMMILQELAAGGAGSGRSRLMTLPLGML